MSVYDVPGNTFEENTISGVNLETTGSLLDMIRCILICHDVLRINGELSGASQDELVLMQMVEQKFNSRFVLRDSDSIKIELQGKVETYFIKKINEFSSDRKMMSISVMREADGKMINFAKGADMVILNKLARKVEEENRLVTNLNKFAEKGLRTLMFAMRYLESDYLLNSEN